MNSENISQQLSAIALIVPDYAAAIAYYVGKLGFRLLEDTPLTEAKRWVVVAPPGASETGLLLARADSDQQAASIGNQAGGRVFLFLRTNDFDRDYRKYLAAGVEFLEAPRSEAYGKVAVFRDEFGNKWDLIGPLAK
jgi:catechol 2,3-dioxygenase-like lactoylglutathione lyase family enzyme